MPLRDMGREQIWMLPPSLGFVLTRLVGLLLQDVVLTRDDVDGLMAGLLTSGVAPTGMTRLGIWLEENADGLGREYVGELRRNYRSNSLRTIRARTGDGGGGSEVHSRHLSLSVDGLYPYDEPMRRDADTLFSRNHLTSELTDLPSTNRTETSAPTVLGKRLFRHQI